ncbi:putative UPF0481 protein At3g02645 [Cynara cardunculus var. scolymus]|uniref:putative UPF0481 protein At3g02645 n=1 Tax=Cynara cardunculus var. scolymus TaxID=59895 RepID=UPI000D62B087|nr:putative UPF0481 protein At3g02645 [Cynara cardunculus var. scolymus]
MTPDSILNGDFSEKRWVDQISKNFDNEVCNEVPVCVFSVPESISHFKPEAYVPLVIALGPYHHFQTHLYQMERYKVAAIKALLNLDQVLSFESLVIHRLKEKDPMIRTCYHKYMNLDDDTLAWIIAIDGLFLLGLFMHYGEIAPLMPKKLINNGVLYRDVMVLENQIPLCLLNEIWKSLFLSSTVHDDNGDRQLLSMLKEFCEVHSPLKLASDSNHGAETNYLHLLDLMYHLIINNQATIEHEDVEDMAKEDNLTENSDRPMKVIKNIPWEKISNLLGLKIWDDDKEEDDPSRIMEIEIPSVSSLIKYGRINFSHMIGGIREIKFEESEATLYLPVITLNGYTEVVLRNLIAYEMATSSSTPELAQYVNLMSGIVDTEVDVKLLRAKGIIEGNMNDKEIANLFNGMNKYKGRTNKTIEQLNDYYNNRPGIKAWRFMKKDLLRSQKVATIVVTVFICLLMILYSFCEVYGCPRLLDRT